MYIDDPCYMNSEKQGLEGGVVHAQKLIAKAGCDS
jgi:hypothetical protein